MELTEKEKCTGCGACYSACPEGCITMRADKEGFLFPEISRDKCTDCGSCLSSCPVENKDFVPISGYPECFLARDKDVKVRKAGASGGVFTSVAAEFIKKHNGVVFGAAYDKNFIVRHTYTENFADAGIFSKSKYVQSDIGDTFRQVKEFLLKDRYVLFSGTPCQIYGLKGYLKEDYENLYCIDVVCHGVPSPKVFAEYLKYQEKVFKSGLKKVSVREKQVYRDFYRAGFGLEFDNGKRYFEVSDQDPMGKIYFGEICSRHTCYDCPFKTVWRVSDLTIGDCWFSRELAGVADPDGITLVLIQSEKGLSLIEESESLEYYKVDPESAIKANGGKIYSSVKPHKNRDIFFTELEETDFISLVNKYFPEKKSFSQKLMSNIKDKALIPKSMVEEKNRKRFEERLKWEIPEEAKGRAQINGQ